MAGRWGGLLCALSIVLASPCVLAAGGRADFKLEPASAEVSRLADWIVDSGDNGRLPFVIVDKHGARVFVFSADGGLRGASPALLGQSSGDDSAPGIGTRKLADIRPEERTTPAGRFVASLGQNLHGAEVWWVDYDAAISLHPVVTGNARERRLQRLASATPLDNRISYGCINVPPQFYRNVVSPAFRQSDGIVYILPETRPASAVFPRYPAPSSVDGHAAGAPPRP